jgi:hypothetical protein
MPSVEHKSDKPEATTAAAPTPDKPQKKQREKAFFLVKEGSHAEAREDEEGQPYTKIFQKGDIVHSHSDLLKHNSLGSEKFQKMEGSDLKESEGTTTAAMQEANLARAKVTKPEEAKPQE